MDDRNFDWDMLEWAETDGDNLNLWKLQDTSDYKRSTSFLENLLQMLVLVTEAAQLNTLQEGEGHYSRVCADSLRYYS